MLVTVNKTCHMLHTSQTTLGTIFFGVSKELVRSWSHASLITTLKTFAKTTFGSPSKNTEEKEKTRKKKGNCKAFCVTHKRKNILVAGNNNNNNTIACLKTMQIRLF